MRFSPGSRAIGGPAPALVYTAGFDISATRARVRAAPRRGRRAVVFRCYEPLPHGFTSFGGVAPAAARAQDEIARDVDLVFSRGSDEPREDDLALVMAAFYLFAA